MDSRDTAVAANLLSRKIDTWIEDLRIYAKTAPGLRGGEGLRSSWSSTERGGSHLQNGVGRLWLWPGDGDSGCGRTFAEGGGGWLCPLKCVDVI